jgi:hypothetical protein
MGPPKQAEARNGSRSLFFGCGRSALGVETDTGVQRFNTKGCRRPDNPLGRHRPARAPPTEPEARFAQQLSGVLLESAQFDPPRGTYRLSAQRTTAHQYGDSRSVLCPSRGASSCTRSFSRNSDVGARAPTSVREGSFDLHSFRVLHRKVSKAVPRQDLSAAGELGLQGHILCRGAANYRARTRNMKQSAVFG